MFARSFARLWTPNYFRGHQLKAARHVGPRRTRTVASAAPSSPTSEGATAAAAAEKAAAVEAAVRPSRHNFDESAVKTAHAAVHAHEIDSAPTTKADPLVQRAQELLLLLSHPCAVSPPPSSPQRESGAEATRNFVDFAARRDVLGPLRQRLPAAPASLGASLPRAAPSLSTSTGMNGSMARLRVVSSPVSPTAPVAKPETVAMRPFTLEELVVFLQLYDAVSANDGQLLVQLMADVHRKLLAYAAVHSAAATAAVTSSAPLRAPNSLASSAKTTEEEKKAERSVVNNVGQASPPPTPFPALLFTLSSLGLVEEAVLDLITSAAPVNGSPARRGLLYRQLPQYSAVELVTLLIALHRFGHHQQPSMKAVTKALRASLYNKATAAGAFHRQMKELKKRLYRSRDAGSEEAIPSEASLSNDAGNGKDNAVWAIQTRVELQLLVLQLQCPLFLLLEALTASSLTVHRRTDVIIFLSDLIAVTAVLELTQAPHSQDTTTATEADGSFDHSARGSQEESSQEYILSVAHQLLRAAKLTEEMELPQPLLSEVFAWSCTRSSKGVIVDGGEDSDVPSDRLAFYDHVTADLIKVNRAD